MAQYFPTYKALENKEIDRKLTKEEYKEIENYLYELNLENISKIAASVCSL